MTLNGFKIIVQLILHSILYFYVLLDSAFYFKILKAITMILSGKVRLRYQDQKHFQIYYVNKKMMDVFQYSIRVMYLQSIIHQSVFFSIFYYGIRVCFSTQILLDPKQISLRHVKYFQRLRKLLLPLKMFPKQNFKDENRQEVLFIPIRRQSNHIFMSFRRTIDMLNHRIQ